MHRYSTNLNRQIIHSNHDRTFNNTNLSNHTLSGRFNGNFNNCDLTGTTLSGSFNGDFNNCDLTGATIPESFNGNLNNCDLTNVTFLGQGHQTNSLNSTQSAQDAFNAGMARINLVGLDGNGEGNNPWGFTNSNPIVPTETRNNNPLGINPNRHYVGNNRPNNYPNNYNNIIDRVDGNVSNIGNTTVTTPGGSNSSHYVDSNGNSYTINRRSNNSFSSNSSDSSSENERPNFMRMPNPSRIINSSNVIGNIGNTNASSSYSQPVHGVSVRTSEHISKITFPNGIIFKARTSINYSANPNQITVYLNNATKFELDGAEYSKEHFPDGLEFENLKLKVKFSHVR